MSERYRRSQSETATMIVDGHGCLSADEAWLKLMETETGRTLARACYYDWDPESACRRFRQSEEWSAVEALLSRHCPRGRESLDLGAGNGIGSYALSLSGHRVTAVEPGGGALVGQQALTRMIQTTQLPIDRVAAVGEALPFRDGHFDLVYARQVLHHARDLRAMTAEIARVLAVGGMAVLCREHVVDGPESLQAFRDQHPLHRYTGGEGAYPLEEYLDALSLAGLKAVQILGPWDSVINHYPLGNSHVLQEIRAQATARYGWLGLLLARCTWWQRRYRRCRSKMDQQPGRLYTFVARK